jgi:uroporphyrinogen decarboxylase
MLYRRPDLLERILEVNAEAVAAYLNAQIEAGAQVVMIFDSWGGVLADGAFQQFSLAYTARVLGQLKREHEGQRIPRIVFTKGGAPWLDEMGGLDCEVLGLDWTASLAHARAVVGGTVGGPGKALQGNLDPNVLFASPAQIRAEVAKVLESYGTPHTEHRIDPATGLPVTGPSHIFNLGHGISQHTPPESVAVLVDAVHACSRQMRR